VAQFQEILGKLNPRERLSAWGALGIAVGWIVGLTASYGLGGNSLALIGAIAVVVIFYLKYAPNQTISWPAPVPTIVLVISGIVALGAVLTLLNLMSFLGIAGGFFAGAILASLVTAIGALVMVWGAWQEYQLTAPAAAAGSSSPTMAPPAPSAPVSDPSSATDGDEAPLA
jgi:hypothetical protein